MTKHKMTASIIQLALLLAVSSYSSAQNFQQIRFGDKLSKWQSSFKSAGVSSRGVCKSYESIKPLQELYWNRKAAKIIISTQNNLVVRKVLFLIPNNDDIDVPRYILDDMESSLGYKFRHVVNSSGSNYGLKIDDVFISISRVANEISSGKDRIMIFIEEPKACK